ncbi:MAG: hypothetical protein QXO15_04545 [Nitrososphaerota archaeon]
MEESREKYCLIEGPVEVAGGGLAAKMHYLIEEDPRLIGEPEKIAGMAEGYGWAMELDKVYTGLRILGKIENDLAVKKV